MTPLWTLLRVLAVAGEEVQPPAGGCIAAVPGWPRLLVPIGPMPGAPVTDWPIRTEHVDTGVTLGELEWAMEALR